MCEILGMSFNQLVSPNLSFKDSVILEKKNPHGWGIA